MREVAPIPPARRRFDGRVEIDDSGHLRSFTGVRPLSV
jgi:hypothetical protein